MPESDLLSVPSQPDGAFNFQHKLGYLLGSVLNAINVFTYVLEPNALPRLTRMPGNSGKLESGLQVLVQPPCGA